MPASRAWWQNGQVPLSWGTVAGATDYRVQYRIGAGSWTQTAWETAANVTVGTLVNETTYESQVQASNTYGTGPRVLLGRERERRVPTTRAEQCLVGLGPGMRCPGG
jgi:hypothetical protein